MIEIYIDVDRPRCIAAADRFPVHIFTTSFTIRNPNKPLISAAGRPPFKIRHGSNAGPSITRLILTKRLIRNAILRPVTSVLNATSISIRERERLGDSNSATEFSNEFLSFPTVSRRDSRIISLRRNRKFLSGMKASSDTASNSTRNCVFQIFR